MQASVNLVVSEICHNLTVLIYKELQTKKRYNHRGQSYRNILYGR